MAVDSVARAIAVKNGSGGGGGGGGTSNYNDLSNKPSINGVTLSGNKTTEDLGLLDENNYADATNKPSINNVTLEGDQSAADLGLMTFQNIPHNEEIPEDNGLYAKLNSTDSWGDDSTGVASNMEEYVLVNEGEVSKLFTVSENPSNGGLIITNYKLIKNVPITKPGGAYAYIRFNTSLSDEQVAEILDSLDDPIYFYMNSEGSDYRIIIDNGSIALYGDEGYEIATIYTVGEGWSEDVELVLAKSGFMGCCFIVDSYSYEENLEKIADLVSADYYVKVNQPINGLFEEKYEYGGYTHTRLISDKNVKTKLVFAENLDYIDSTIPQNTYSSFYINSLMSKEEVVTVLTKTFNHRFYTDGMIDFTADVIQNDDEYAGVSRVIQIHFSVLGGFSIINHEISDGTDYTIFDETHGWAANLNGYEGPLSGFRGSDLYPNYGLFKFNENYQWSSCIFLIFSSKLFVPVCSLESIDENQILTTSDDINQEGNYNLKVDGVAATYQQYELVDKLYLNSGLSGADAVECFEAFYFPFDYQNHTLELIKCQGATIVLYINNRNNLYYQLFIRYDDNTSKIIFFKSAWQEDGVEAFNNLVGPFRTLSSSIQNYSGTPILLGKTVYSKSWAPASGGGDIPANIECETATLTESGSDKTLYLTKDVVALLDDNASTPKSTQMAAGMVVLCNDDGTNPTHITTINDTQISVTDTTNNSATAAVLTPSQLSIANASQTLNAGITKDGITIRDVTNNLSNVMTKDDSTITNGHLSTHVKCDRFRLDSNDSSDVVQLSLGQLSMSNDNDDASEISPTGATFVDADRMYETRMDATGIYITDTDSSVYSAEINYSNMQFLQTSNGTDYASFYGAGGFKATAPGLHTGSVEGSADSGFKTTGTYSSKSCIGQLTPQMLLLTQGTGSQAKMISICPDNTSDGIITARSGSMEIVMDYDSISLKDSGSTYDYQYTCAPEGFSCQGAGQFFNYSIKSGLATSKFTICTIQYDTEAEEDHVDNLSSVKDTYVGQVVMLRFYDIGLVEESASVGIITRKGVTEWGNPALTITTSLEVVDMNGQSRTAHRLFIDLSTGYAELAEFDIADAIIINEVGNPSNQRHKVEIINLL